MRERNLRKINKAFEEFGRNPHGQLNYRWFQTTDLHYLYERGMEASQLPSGLYVSRTTYERHDFAKLYGNRWVLAKWEPPMEYQQWVDTIGTAFPWPKHGEYHLIGSTLLPEGAEPTEGLTAYTVSMLRGHLEMKHRDHLSDANLSIEKNKKAEQSRVDAWVDDVGPAFGNVPGRKGHVSFPIVAK